MKKKKKVFQKVNAGNVPNETLPPNSTNKIQKTLMEVETETLQSFHKTVSELKLLCDSDREKISSRLGRL